MQCVYRAIIRIYVREICEFIKCLAPSADVSVPNCLALGGDHGSVLILVSV